MNRDLYLHRGHGYVGWLDGTTRIKHLFEDAADTEEPRVRLPDGTIRVASRQQLLRLDTPEAVLEAHRWLLKRLGIPYGGTRAADGHNQTVSTGCWQCKHPVASWVNYQCLACNRFICECGACLCGWEGGRVMRGVGE